MTNHLRHINEKTIRIFGIPEQYVDDLIQMGKLPTNNQENDVEAVDLSQFDKIYAKLNKRLGVKK